MRERILTSLEEDFKQFGLISESVQTEDVNVLSDYLQKALDMKIEDGNPHATGRFKKKTTSNGVFFFKSNMDGTKESYGIDYLESANEILFHFLVERVTKSVSLADPRATYQTTSAKRVSTKKFKLDDGYEDLEKAKKAIDKFVAKLKAFDSNK